MSPPGHQRTRVFRVKFNVDFYCIDQIEKNSCPVFSNSSSNKERLKDSKVRKIERRKPVTLPH